MDRFFNTIGENQKKTGLDPVFDIAMTNTTIVCIDRDNDSGNTRTRRVASMVQDYFSLKFMRHTIAAMLEKPLLGEPEGNCHNIALAFMTDLIIARQAQDWYWVQGANPKKELSPGRVWEHSWLEYNGIAVDATMKQRLQRELPTIVVDQVGPYYKRQDITKILERRNARQTRRFIFRFAKNERREYETAQCCY